ncbi:STAS domain-containing protein [Nannocystis exedens]|uniref:STAS domain-containing protein n=1 Tax=Nannocystis exedens TaxID=54 RepID=A0A1I2IHU1_9BACT|nr:STAS domain-containing protein [Nannocystis exedens]PCC67185.1 RsbT co-antagonist protein RsbRA [Nannocystis exedens]SFF41208.1 STAS domain-containing protein [Nannocystis exedens]
MHTPFEWIERERAGLTAALAEGLGRRAGSVFRSAGRAACEAVADGVIAALAADLASGKDTAGREAMSALVRRFSGSLGYADLRHLTTTLRALVLAAATEAAPAERQRVEDWLFQLVLVGAMRFVAQREQTFQEQAAQLEVRQLESQLEELRAAFEEKTRLLDVIRQASTPVAPVYEGIVVVPLVGLFDAQRAQLLTERLLHAIGESRASVVIVDISGVPLFDSEAAQLVIRTSQAVRLLGAQLLLVGLSPGVAQTIVGLGVELSSLKTLSSLQDGIAHALALRKLRIAPMASR